MSIGDYFSTARSTRPGPLETGSLRILQALPVGHRIEMDRGNSYYREVEGPAQAPTLLLLHGWMATGGLNWLRGFEALGREFRVIAPDLRGHGQGIRSWRRFRLEDCADDAAELIDRLGTGPVIAVGYSMGGAVAQLLWRRHPERVRGLVLCATGATMMANLGQRVAFGGTLSALANAARLAQFSSQIPAGLFRAMWPAQAPRTPDTLRAWVTSEFSRHDWRMLIEAGSELGRFSSWNWIDEVDVPTSVVVTTQDTAIDAARQLQMALKIPGASIIRAEGGHLSCAYPEFSDPLLAACQGVASRSALAKTALAS